MVSPDFLPIWSGIGTYTVSLLSNLSSDLDVHLITVKRQICKEKPNSEQEAQREILSQIEKKVKIHYVSSAKDTFFHHLNFQMKCAKAIPPLCRNEQIDLIHANFPLMSDIFAKIFMRLDVPTLSTVHSTIDGQHFGVRNAGIGISSLERSDKANLFLYYPLKLCELLYARCTSFFIAVSNSVREELINYVGVKAESIKTIYNGIDTQLFHPGKRESDNVEFIPSDRWPIILSTGRFVATKGVDIIIQAIPEVVASFPRALFVFVGGGNFIPYQNYLERKGVSSKNFMFRGYVANFLDMPAVYCSSSVYVAPSIYEPLGIKILEAMSCARPVVATEVGGIPEIITSGHDGILIQPRNGPALAQAIIQILEDRHFAAHLGENARKTVLERFSVEEMAEKTCEFYRRVVNNYRCKN